MKPSFAIYLSKYCLAVILTFLKAKSVYLEILQLFPCDSAVDQSNNASSNKVSRGNGG